MARDRFRHDSRSCLRASSDDGLTFLFHLPSGQTHIVAPPIPEILDLLGQGEADALLIEQRLSGAFDIVPGEGVAAIEARLEELEAVGLVQRR